MTDNIFTEAKKFIPGGVNSPVRAFKAVGGDPVFMERAAGCKIYDCSGKEYVDYCLSWGAMILGHAHGKVKSHIKKALDGGTSLGAATEKEVELAQLIVEAVPSVEKVRLTNSGTEAVMGAVRLARAFTSRDKIIKFEGAYHGHADHLLARRREDNGKVLSEAISPGIPKDIIKKTLVLPFNDLKMLEETVRKSSSDLAAIIVEPVMGNRGVIVPDDNFLTGLRKLSDKFGIVLVFDEVITGFRLSYGGAQKLFKVYPDLTCMGKIAGGGLPIGAFGGKKEIMRFLAPQGAVYQAGTFSGNALSVAAAIATLRYLKKNMPYEELAEKMCYLSDGFLEEIEISGKKGQLNSVGSMFSFFFPDERIGEKQAKHARGQNPVFFKRFFHELLKKGIYLSPSPLEANFLSIAHTYKELKYTLKIFKETLNG